MFLILETYDIPSQVVNAIRIMYGNTSASVIIPEGETDFFMIKTGVLQGDPLASLLFIVVLDYALRTSILQNDEITLKQRRSRRDPVEYLSNLDYADDIALLEDTILAVQSLLLKVEKACQDVGQFLNAPKTKYMHLNPSNDTKLYSSDGTEIDCVNDFKYLGSFTDTAYDMDVRIAQAWSALNTLQKIWKTPVLKQTKTKASVESILLYGAESWALNVTKTKRLDGVYTKMLRAVYNLSWKDLPTNAFVYGSLLRISEVVRRRRLALAGHTARHNEPAGRLLTWVSEEPKRVGWPIITLNSIIQDDTGLEGQDLIKAMKDRDLWKKNYVNVSPNG